MMFCLQYTDSMLYNQICFYQYCFDFDKAMGLLKDNSKEKSEYMGDKVTLFSVQVHWCIWYNYHYTCKLVYNYHVSTMMYYYPYTYRIHSI